MSKWKRDGGLQCRVRCRDYVAGEWSHELYYHMCASTNMRLYARRHCYVCVVRTESICTKKTRSFELIFYSSINSCFFLQRNGIFVAVGCFCCCCCSIHTGNGIAHAHAIIWNIMYGWSMVAAIECDALHCCLCVCNAMDDKTTVDVPGNSWTVNFCLTIFCIDIDESTCFIAPASQQTSIDRTGIRVFFFAVYLYQ